jgi:predicted HTH domain antitoxin
MNDTVDERVELLETAWREFQACVPVKLGFIENEQHYAAMVDFMNELLGATWDQEVHPASTLLHLVGLLVEEYEERVDPIPELQDLLPAKAELRAAVATKLYELGRVGQGVAAQIAGVSRSEFLTVLSQHKVSPFQETADEALAGAKLLLQS